MKKLKNVFLLPADKKSVYLADVEFDELIRNIKLIKEFSADPVKLVKTMEQLKAKNNHYTSSPTIDGNYNLLIPGAVDAHVHFDEPGFEFREDFYTGTLSAAFGGVTTVIDMPCTSIPPVTNKKNLMEKLAVVSKNAVIDFSFWGGVSGTQFDNEQDIAQDMKKLARAGVVGFKTYLLSGMKEFTELNAKRLERVGQIAKKLKLPVAVHSEDKQLVTSRRQKFQENKKNDFKHYAKARDVKAEVRAIKTVIKVAEKTGARFHIVHLSSKKGLQLIKEAQKSGIDINTETCPHFLAFTQADYKKIGSILKTAPPIKKAMDRKALWQGLCDNDIDFVVTDHAGCDPEKEKFTNNIWTDYAGIPGTELLVPYIFSKGYLRGRISLKRAVNLISENAARYYGIYPQKGSININTDADLTLLDLTEKYIIDPKNLHCKGKYTPFAGKSFKTKVKNTFCRGKLLVDDNQFFGNNGYGSFIKPS